MPDTKNDAELLESVRRPSDWKPADLAAQTRRTGDALERERARRERRRKQRRRVAASARPKRCPEPEPLRGDDVVVLVARVREDIRKGHAERSRLERLCDAAEQMLGEREAAASAATKEGASDVQERGFPEAGRKSFRDHASGGH
jgi:hypothetical protein